MIKIKQFLCRGYLIFMAALLMGSSVSMYSQQVTGTVVDENNDPLIGVNVVVAGTSTGSITNMDGNYSIEVPDLVNDALSFSFVGYETKMVPVEGRTIIDVQMDLSSEILEDVVVIGYGTVKKEDLTGAVSVVTNEDLNRSPIPNLGKAIQGRASGVVVMQSGDPGGNLNIRVRGIGSITSDPDPLIVIDGVVGGNLNSVSPEDIESISVLKDASATAIYGANGANGVIMITTKRGKGDRLSVSASAYTGMNFRPRKFNLMDATQYAEFYNAVYDANQDSRQFAYTDEFRQWYYGEGWETGTDWQDEIIQKSRTSNAHINISNGGERANYSISARLYDETGILLNSNARRYNFRANSDFKLGDYVTVGESVIFTRSRWQTSSGSAWGMSLESSPLMRVNNENNKEGFEGSQIGYLYDPDGDGDGEIISNTGGNDKFNPKGYIAVRDDQHYSDNLLANVYVEIRPAHYLSFTSTPSISAYYNENRRWIPAYDMGVRSVKSANLHNEFSKGNTYSLENKLNFENSFGDHFINFVAVHHVRYGDYANVTIDATGFPYEQLNVISQSNPDGRIATGGSSELSFGQVSYLGRLIYNYKSKYLFTASIRRDGSSNFQEGSRWGNFPSFSAAWKINEDFLRNVDQINMLKIRAGWGMTGNSNIGGFRYQTSLAEPVHFSPVFGIDQVEAVALNELWTVGNPLIRWESANMTNIGIDLNAFRNRLQLSAEYYVKNQDGLLMEVPISTAFGKWSDHGAFYNIAEIQNRGFEFDVSYSNMEGMFNYRTYASLSTVKNEVVYMPSSIISDNNITRIGNSIGCLFGWVAEGIVQESDFDEEGNYLFAEPSEGIPSPGDLRFKDLNGDGMITDADRTIIGKAIPDFSYSFGVDLYYGNFDLSVFFYGIHNAQIYNTQKRDLESFEQQDLDHNKSADWANNYYSENNQTTEYLRLDPNDSNLNTRISSWWVEDASFLRVKDIQLGYQLPANMALKLNMKKARIYLSAVNFYTFTNYSGYDPESPLNSDEPTLPGVDANNYPLPRTIMAGIQLDF
ncbi:MAG: TonB-dependent receptor [Bacteroidales bacterium]|nr:TonB-dependent receptor [Bacteroidales bacterium]